MVVTKADLLVALWVDMTAERWVGQLAGKKVELKAWKLVAELVG